MKRFQVYLESETMDILSTISNRANISRSRLLQEMADTLAQRYMLLADNQPQSNRSILAMAGIIDTQSSASTSSSIKSDAQYFGI